MLVVKTASFILSFFQEMRRMRRMRRMRTERPIVAVKLFNTENRSSVSAAILISAGDGEPL